MNKKFEYQITAYDKDHDIYDIINVMVFVICCDLIFKFFVHGYSSSSK